jgi:hypothetical protein
MRPDLPVRLVALGAIAALDLQGGRSMKVYSVSKWGRRV